jgi:hypothetical protein
MRDILAAIRTFLVGKPEVVAEFGSRVYAGRHLPPIDGANAYTPDLGTCLCFSLRGGSVNYCRTAHELSVQFIVYGQSEIDVMRGYGIVFDLLDDKVGDGIVRWGQLEVAGQSLVDPETNWPMVLSFFKVWINA